MKIHLSLGYNTKNWLVIDKLTMQQSLRKMKV
jgi:hypothetical protein